MPKLRKCHICGKHLHEIEKAALDFGDEPSSHVLISRYGKRVNRLHFCTGCHPSEDVRQEYNKPKNQRARERNAKANTNR